MPVGGRRLRVFLFTDLVDSTALKQRLGDEAGAAAIAAHDELFRSLLARFGGREEGDSGDGFFATFEVPSAALGCALEFQRLLPEVEAPERLKVRIGIHMGEHIEDPGAHHKLLGLAIDVSARVMGLAEANQILVTRHVYDSARQNVRNAPDGNAVRFEAHGLYVLKGVEDPMEIYEAGVDGTAPFTAPPDSSKAKRAETADTGARLGPFAIRERVGAGGMGVVYRAEAVQTVGEIGRGDVVALKVPHAHLIGEKNFFDRFVREGEAGARVHHPNVVRTYEAGAGTLDGKPAHYLAMEYVEGQTLRSLLGELGRAPEELCRHVAREVALALAAIHAAGIVHRDMKPENVLITEDQRIKVMDLGVAHLKDAAEKLSSTGWFVGSVLYAAPEQFSGKGVDGRADLYALGLVLYELTTGVHPFDGEDPAMLMTRHLNDDPRPVSEVNPQLSPFLEELIVKLLAKDPEDRFPSAAVLAEVLAAGEESEWWSSRARALRAGTKRPLRRVRVPRETALYGRDRELAHLRERFEAAKAGRGGVVLVDGEAGIGKSRLVDEFVGGLQQDGEQLHFLVGSYPPGGAATAAGAFMTAYREHFGGDGLRPLLRHYLRETPALVPSFAALLRGEPPPRGNAPLTQDSVQTVFVEITRSLAEELPVVVLVDDLHFAPQEGLALFAALAHAAPESRLLLVGTARPGVAREWTSNVERLEYCSRLPLPRLGPKDLTRLLVDAFKSEQLAADLAFRIARKADGNPFFVFEIVRELREGNYVAQEADGSWVQQRAVDSIEIPSSVLDLIQARLAGLDEEDKDLLDVAACCGFEFDPLLVAAALGEPELPVLKRLGRIERTHRLVHSAGRHCQFDHHQVQEALYTGLNELLKERYHAALADALEARVGDEPASVDGRTAVELCSHALSGSRNDAARRFLHRALDHLAGSQQVQASVELAGRALERDGLLEEAARFEVLLVRRTGLSQLGRREEEHAAVEEAVRLADANGPPAHRALARGHLADHLAKRSDYDGAFRALGEAADYARAAGDQALEGRTLRQWGVQLMYLGRYDESRERFESAIAIARDTASRVDEVASRMNLAVIDHYAGRFAAAMAGFKDCAWFFQESGQQTKEAVATTNLGFLCSELGRPDEGRQLIERALRTVHELGDRYHEAFCLDWLGHVAGRMEKHAGAKRRYRDALALRRRIDDKAGVADTLIGLARVEIIDGELDEATRHLDEAIALAEQLALPGATVLSHSQRSLLPDGETGPVREALERHQHRLRHREQMEVRFNIWRVDADRAELEKAWERLTFLREHAPEADRDAMMRNVPMHRDILAAAGAQGLA